MKFKAMIRFALDYHPILMLGALVACFVLVIVIGAMSGCATSKRNAASHTEHLQGLGVNTDFGSTESAALAVPPDSVYRVENGQITRKER